MVESANDNFRYWYDEKTNTNIQLFTMFLFFVLYHWMPTGIGNSAWEFFGVLIFGQGIFWGFDFCYYSIIPVT